MFTTQNEIDYKYMRTLLNDCNEYLHHGAINNCRPVVTVMLNDNEATIYYSNGETFELERVQS